MEFVKLFLLLLCLKLLLGGIAKVIGAVTEAKEKARERRRERFRGWESPPPVPGRGVSDDQLRRLAGNDLLRGIREMEEPRGNTKGKRR